MLSKIRIKQKVIISDGEKLWIKSGNTQRFARKTDGGGFPLQHVGLSVQMTYRIRESEAEIQPVRAVVHCSTAKARLSAASLLRSTRARSIKLLVSTQPRYGAVRSSSIENAGNGLHLSKNACVLPIVALPFAGLNRRLGRGINSVFHLPLL